MSYSAEVLADSPSAYMRLGEASGTACADAIGGAAGTYLGGFTLGQAGALAGDVDTAVGFNGFSSRVQFADRAAFDRGDVFTLEAWIKLGAINRNNCIVDKGANGYIFRVHSDNRLLLRRNGVGDVVKSTITLTTGVWYHVVATKNGPTVKLYIDDVDRTGTVTNQTMTDTAIAFGIGAADAGTSDFTNGTIDEVAVYPTALSAARVHAHYNAGIATGEVIDAAAALGGAAALTATPRRARRAATTVSGAANLSAVPRRDTQSQADLAAVSSLVVTGARHAAGAVVLPASGGLTATPRRTRPAATAVSGISDLAAAGRRTRAATASLAGSATITAAPASTIVTAAISLTAASDLTATPRRARRSTSTIGGAASLQAVGRRSTASAASLTAMGALTGTGRRRTCATATASATSTLAGQGRRRRLGAVALAGDSGMTATAVIPFGGGTIANGNRRLGGVRTGASKVGGITTGRRATTRIEVR